MTLTLDIPPHIEAAKRERLAVDLYDARLVSQSEAAQIAGLSRAAFIDALGRHGVTRFQYDADETSGEPDGHSTTPSKLVQGSSEWNTRLHSIFRADVSLTDEQTRRENIYGDDLR